MEHKTLNGKHATALFLKNRLIDCYKYNCTLNLLRMLLLLCVREPTY